MQTPNTLRSRLPIFLTLAWAVATALHPASVRAQMAGKDLVGTWNLTSISSEQNGVKTETYGPGAKGQLLLDAGGRFSTIYSRADLPKFASNARTTGTPEENKAIVQGSLAYFGTYTVTEADKTINLRIETSTFPNWNGTDQKRTYTLSGDELTIINAQASGGGTAQVVWKRAK